MWFGPSSPFGFNTNTNTRTHTHTWWVWGANFSQTEFGYHSAWVVHRELEEDAHAVTSESARLEAPCKCQRKWGTKRSARNLNWHAACYTHCYLLKQHQQLYMLTLTRYSYTTTVVPIALFALPTSCNMLTCPWYRMKTTCSKSISVRPSTFYQVISCLFFGIRLFYNTILDKWKNTV